MIRNQYQVRLAKGEERLVGMVLGEQDIMESQHIGTEF